MTIGIRTPARTAGVPVPQLVPVLPWLAVAIGIGAQIAYPLTSGSTLDLVTLLSVLAFFAAVTGALAVAGGVRPALWCAGIALVTGWAVEAVGVHTGLPFGRYEYTTQLGGSLASVPLIVPFAWAGMAPIALLVGRRLTAGRAGTAVIGACLLTTWDLFLDPQMVADGRWRWTDPGTAIPGVPGIPVSNFLGWLVVSALLVAVLDRILPAVTTPVTTTVLGWIYCSQVLAGAVFFHRPWVALVGGIAMGCLVLPCLRKAAR